MTIQIQNGEFRRILVGEIVPMTRSIEIAPKSIPKIGGRFAAIPSAIIQAEAAAATAVNDLLRCGAESP